MHYQSGYGMAELQALAGKKKKKKAPKPAASPSSPPAVMSLAPSALPRWMPYAVGIAGVAVVGLIFITGRKGK